jgi:hypothetical protein
MTTSATTASSSLWHDVLRARHLRVLPPGRFVPVDVWLEDPRSPGLVLHLLARGTAVRLTAYERTDLTTLLLRAECDCEEHRLAGAVGRLVLRPGARPVSRAGHDGTTRSGWTGVEAGLLRRDEVAPLLAELHDAIRAELPTRSEVPRASGSVMVG